ncbi:MAG: hypothetical protein JF616_12645 [Fibrobacteres bacterium]|nr:hypothetical protein [Fibrobacterota bacterium]
MTKPEISPKIEGARGPVLTEVAEAPHSWDPAGRNVPATKLDWTECLPFAQVRGLEVAPDRPDRALPGPGDSEDNPE